MVSDKESIGRRAANPHSRLERKALLLFATLGHALLLGCVSRAGPSHEMDRLAAVLAASPPQEPAEPGENERPSSTRKFRLHVAGLVECSGFLRKSQTSYGEAWLTSGGPNAPRVNAEKLQLRLEYRGGLFQGRITKENRDGRGFVRSSDVVYGNLNSDPCGCVRFTANAETKTRGIKLRARTEVCPGG
jgi:hypothetical protein